MFIPSIPCGQTPAFPPNDTVPVGSPGFVPMGMGCARPGVGCGCAGMGLFDSGLDFSQWGISEWSTVVGGLYLLYSVFSTTRRAAHSVHRKTRAALRA